MADFKPYQKLISDKVSELAQESQLYVVNIDKGFLWDLYLDSYPAEVRQEYNCNCCRSFIKNMGAVVAIKADLTLETVWVQSDTVDPIFNNVSKVLNDYIKSLPILEVAFTKETTIGQAVSTNSEFQIVWNHLYCKTPSSMLITNYYDSVDAKRGAFRTNVETFERALNELSLESANIVLELTNQKSLYRGEQYLNQIKKLIEYKTKIAKVSEEKRKNFYWKYANQATMVATIRNSAIGTLLIDLSEGMDIEKAVTRYEKVVAPTNYKRPKAIYTAKMVEEAEKTIVELGYENSLGRKHATIDELNVTNTLFIDSGVNKSINSVFDDLKETIVVDSRNLKKVEEITAKDFIEKVLPSAKTVEILFENKHQSNLVSLIGPVDPSAPSIFKWNNAFSWSYNDAVTDSMREKVVALGGRVDGVFRFTHSWNHTGENQSLMDLHVFLPTHSGQTSKTNMNKEIHDNYGNRERVGWNNRNHSKTKGVQDVDFTNPPGENIPLENITFPNVKLMPEGDYVCKIHNWAARNPNKTGYKAELEFGGQIYQFERSEPMSNKEWVTVAIVNLKDGVFTLKSAGEASPVVKTLWGMQTNTFHKVNAITKSPNFWGDNKTGNEHLFFFAEGFKNEGEVRGFFNEFLNEDLERNHKKVFEALGGKLKVAPADRQLSGLGFSTTMRNEVTLRVTSNFSRILKVKF